MKICHLVPGSGGTFYCQNCLRDYAMVRALRRQGHDAVMVPLYLPSFGGEFAQNGDMPLFFGGIGVYLRHHVPLFRRAPRWAERLLDSPWLLNLAAAREGSTNAAQLGPMTLSMLEGYPRLPHPNPVNNRACRCSMAIQRTPSPTAPPPQNPRRRIQHHAAPVRLQYDAMKADRAT